MCALSGIIPLCQAGGTKDVGASCTSAIECLAGLGCDAEGHCAAGVAPFAITPFTATCGADVASPFKAYFSVPEVGVALPDFFQLPFPNEARNHVADGKTLTDYTGFPTPAAGPGKSLITSYIDVLSSEQDGGFGLNSPITMRFSAPIHLDSLRYGSQPDPTLFFFKLKLSSGAAFTIDPTTGCAADNDVSDPWQVQAVPGAAQWTLNTSAYLCPNTLSFRPFTENPLEPNTYYAVVLLGDTDPAKSVTAEGSNAVLTRDAGLEAVIGAGTPSGEQATRARTCYKPLREALASHPTAPLARVMGATLFRTARTVDTLTAVKNTFTALPAQVTPEITAIAKCVPGVTSPCAVAGDATRDCPAAESPDFDEYHGKMRVPVVQAGERPYLAEGGFSEFVAGGVTRRFPTGAANETVKIQSTEDVCFSLAMPKGATDVALSVYGHGTGGNFRSAIAEGLAATYTTQSPQKMGVVTIEQPVHGARRGASTLAPDLLYFNPNNPRASRDNAVQAWVDYSTVVATVSKITDGAFALPGLSVSDAAALRAQLPATPRLGFVGHSQGAVNGTAYAISAPVKAMVLSGAGGGLTETLLGKTAPYNFPVLIGAALGDAGLDRFHPVLGLAQQVADRSDAINYGRSYSPPRQPAGQEKSLMHIIGVGDTYVPLATASDLWSTFRSIKAGGPDASPIPASQAEPNTEVSHLSARTNTEVFNGFHNGVDERATALPVFSALLECNCADNGTCAATSNVTAATYTATSILYKGDGTYDDHFVMFNHPRAKVQAPKFMSNALQPAPSCAAASTTKPTIPSP